MRKLLLSLLVILCIIIVGSCVFRPNRTFEQAGHSRSYTLFKPSSHSGQDIPVLFVLHGNPSKSWQIQYYTGLNKLARKSGFAVVYADARTHRWPYTSSNEIDAELDYIVTLIDEVSQEIAIDNSRLYMAGISGGGIFTIIQSERLSEIFAAYAVVAGNIPRSIDLPLSAKSAPIMIIHGTEDFLYAGRDDLYSVPESIAAFQQKNRCGSITKRTMLPDRKKDNTHVERITWDCLEDLVFYKVHGGGHHWPGAKFNADRFTQLELGHFCRDISANELIWDFVSKHSLDTVN